MKSNFRLEYGEIIYRTQSIQVQMAKDLDSGETVCVKQYKLTDKLQQKALETELNSLVRLDHPNVLKVLGCRTLTDEVPKVELILEYCSKRDLCEEINRRIIDAKAWTDSEILSMIDILVGAFRYLQSQNIAHRDVKPDNILINENLLSIDYEEK